MREMDPLGVDFAAIRTLRLVFDHQSFTDAAVELGMNQSSVSYTIERLRHIFGDPLFVRQRGGIAPTDRCVDIVNRCGHLLDEFEGIVAPVEFDPMAASDRVAVSCNFYERLVILPRIIEELRHRAPGLVIEVESAGSRGEAHLRQGRADFLIGPYQMDGTDVYARTLFEDRYVCIMDSEHPLKEVRMSVADYTNANHAVVNYGGEWLSPYMVELDRRGLTLNRKLAVPDLSDLANVLPGTDLISTVPSRYARHFGDAFAIEECPIATSFQAALIWTLRTHHSAVHKWIRSLIVEICNRELGEHP